MTTDNDTALNPNTHSLAPGVLGSEGGEVRGGGTLRSTALNPSQGAGVHSSYHGRQVRKPGPSEVTCRVRAR